MNNNFGTPYGGTFNGTTYGNATPTQPTMTQLLTPEEIGKIRKSPQAFNVKLTEDEYLRSLCTHKDEKGNICVEKLGDGRFHCPICNATFNLIDLNTNKETIDNIALNMEDLFQSIKTYLPNPTKDMRNIYMMIAYFHKVGMLWDIARGAFNKITDNNIIRNDANTNAFSMLNNILSTPGMFGGCFNQAAGNPAFGMQAPQQPQQPAYGYGYGYGMGVPNGAQAQFNGAPTTQQVPNPAANPIGTVEQPQVPNPNVDAMQQPAESTYSINPNITVPETEEK